MCTLVLYKESLHCHYVNSSGRLQYESSLRHMLSLLHSVREAVGTVVLAREMTAQFFETPEATPGFEGEYDLARNKSAPCRSNTSIF